MIQKLNEILVIITTLTVSISCNAQQKCNSLVLSTTPDSRFIINQDQTVLDQQTRLVWRRCAEGQSGPACEGTADRFNWQQALSHAQSESEGQQSAWRLPNYKELLSLIERACSEPAINQNVFPNTPNLLFWSSTPSNQSDDSSWGVGFLVGDALPVNRSVAGGRIRLVRGQ